MDLIIPKGGNYKQFICVIGMLNSIVSGHKLSFKTCLNNEWRIKFLNDYEDT